MSNRSKEELGTKLRGYVGVDVGPPWVGCDLVNEPMARHMCAVVGDENPVYADPEAARSSVYGGTVAPPAMLMAWVMPAYLPPWVASGDDPEKAPVPDNKELELHQLLDRHGYSGVVMVNYGQEYKRYLRPGDHVAATVSIESISEEKATPLGLGYFITMRWIFRDRGGEEVGVTTYRVLKFKPQQQTQPVQSDAAPAKPTRMRAPRGHDNAWWWEGIERGELLIQKCSGCGGLRHPPRPMCGRCQSLEWETARAVGRGAVYSYTVIHHPKFPGFDYPIVCGLIELEEGVRLVSNVVGCEPEEIRIGMPVRLSIENVDDEMKLPLFRPAR